MRIKEKKVSNGSLQLPQEIIKYLNLKDGETVQIEPNEDGSLTIRKRNAIVDLKGIIKRGKIPRLHVNKNYQFERSSKGRG